MDHQVTVVLNYRSEAGRDNAIRILSNLKMPEGRLYVVPHSKHGLAAEYNRILAKDDAPYKIYVSDNIRALNPGLVEYLLQFFQQDPDIGMVGLMGGELPLDGNPSMAMRRYGSYVYSGENGVLCGYRAENPLFLQKVHVLDAGIVATSCDIPWDESMDSDFLMAAQCCRFRRQKLGVYVPMQNAPWVQYHEDRCLYGKDSQMEEEGRARFLENYLDVIQPKVSVLIPAYNQPVFFREALESALAQDYGNLEILVGDDSTNDDVKETLQPYLKKYGNIQYYFHGGPMGGAGKRNMDFLLDHCHGEYINYLQHDDLFYPHKLRRMMEWYVRDLDGEIGLVTSERYKVDSEGKVISKANHWFPRHDMVLDGQTFGRRVFWAMSNFAGETSTMLFRKEDLRKQPQGNSFSVGYYHGVEDRSMWDVSTALELCRKGRKCVYLAECLEAFRKHEGQNTWKPDIVVTALLDWMDFVVLSWLHGSYIGTEADFRFYCNRWRQVHGINVQRVRSDMGHLSEEGRKRYAVLEALLASVDAQEYGETMKIAVEYMAEFADAPKELLERYRKKRQETVVS